jgi:chromosome segregation ATPase
MLVQCGALDTMDADAAAQDSETNHAAALWALGAAVMEEEATARKLLAKWLRRRSELAHMRRAASEATATKAQLDAIEEDWNGDKEAVEWGARGWEADSAYARTCIERVDPQSVVRLQRLTASITSERKRLRTAEARQKTLEAECASLQEALDHAQRDARVQFSRKTALERRLESIQARERDANTRHEALLQRFKQQEGERDAAAAQASRVEGDADAVSTYVHTLLNDISTARHRLRGNQRLVSGRKA